jgi:hypothetical protein
MGDHPDQSEEERLLESSEEEAVNEVETADQNKPSNTTSENGSLPVEKDSVPPLTGMINENLVKLALEKILANMLVPQAHASLSPEDLKWMAMDKAYVTPPSITRVFLEHEKLQGRQNYRSWVDMVKLDLQAANLLPFIEEEHALTKVQVSPNRRKALDAQTVQYIRASLSKNALMTLGPVSSAYEAMDILQKNHGSDKLRDMVDIHYKWGRLRFKSGFDQRRFVYDFNKIVQRFIEYDVTHSDQYLVTSFIIRLEGIRDPLSPMSFFYKQLDSEGIENLTLQTLQSRFIQLDLEPKGGKCYNKLVNSCETILVNSTFVDHVNCDFIVCNASTFTDLGKPSNPRRNYDDARRGESSCSYSTDKPRNKFHDNAKSSGDRARSLNSRKRENTSHHDGLKRVRNSSPTNTRSPLTSGPAMQGKSMYEKYSAAQREKIRTMTPQEKKEARCSKCGEYFHVAKDCVNAGRMCFKCNEYGHEAKNCPRNSSKYDLELSKFTRVTSFFLDSAASHSVVGDKRLLINYRDHQIPVLVKTLQKENLVSLHSVGEGTIPILFQYKNEKTIITLKKVQYVPNTADNVISVNQFNVQFRTTCILNCKSGFLTSRKLKKKIVSIEVRNGIYFVTGKTSRIETESKHINVYFSSLELPDVYKIPGCTSLETISASYMCRQLSGNSPSVSCLKTKITRKRKTKGLTSAQIEKLREAGLMWHRKMGHISAPYVNKLQQVATGVDDLLCSTSINNCTVCAQAKMTRKTFDKDRERATRVGEIIHADLVGPIKPQTYPAKNRYIICMLDDFSRYLQVFTIQSKDMTPSCLDSGFREIQVRYPSAGQFDRLRCDQGSEFTSRASQTVLDKYSVIYQLSETNVHEHNGTCERVNRTVQERIRALLFDSGFPSYMWGQVAHAVCWLYNRSPHSAIDFITPYEKFYAKMPNLEQIKLFGSRCEVFVEDLPKGAKAQSRTETQFLIGYTSTGYSVYNPKNGKTSEVCSLRIYQNEQYKKFFPNQYNNNELSFESDLVDTSKGLTAGGGEIENTTSNIRENDVAGGGIEPQTTCSSIPVTQPSNNPVPKSSPNSGDKLVPEVIEINYDWDDETSPADSVVKINTCFLESFGSLYSNGSYGTYDKELDYWTEIPISYSQALSPLYESVWKEAIEKERNALLKHKVWDIVPRKKGLQTVPVKWLFTLRADGKPKARLVAVGARDGESYTKDDTASPTPSAISLRWMFALAAKEGWSLDQLDISSAFLHGLIDREKYICLPPGFEGDPKEDACKLNKALYGLAISPLCWFTTLNTFLKSLGYKPSPREPCVYAKKNPTNLNKVVLILVFVDDILITGSDSEGIKNLISHLSERFEVQNLGFPTRFLGIQIEKRENNSLFIHQEEYIEKVIKLLNMSGCNKSRIPIHPIGNHKIETNESQLDVPYKSAVGYLQYLAICTRLDISFAVGFLARVQANPQPIHWKLVKQVIGYLKGNPKFGILYSCDKSETIFDAYADADFAAELGRKSTTGYVIRMFGCPIMWCSRLQKTISESTSEAELKAICEATHDILFVKYLTSELLYPIDDPIPVYEDNVGALRHCQLLAGPKRIKHLELKYFKVMEYVQERILNIFKVPSKDQLADVLTKPLLETAFTRVLAQLMNK